MGCGPSAGGAPRPYDTPSAPATAKTATTALREEVRAPVPRGSSGSLHAFSESALNVTLSVNKTLLLLWDGELPSKSANYEQAVMVLKIKCIEFAEEIVRVSNPPAWYKTIVDASLPFLVWRDRTTKAITPAGRPDIKGLFKFLEDHVKHPRLFIPSCMEETRNLGRLGLNELDRDLYALLSLEAPLIVTKQRDAIVASLTVLNKSLSERKFVGPFLFGTSVSVVDVIFAPLFVRLAVAEKTRGLTVPEALTGFHTYRSQMMSTELMQTSTTPFDVLLQHFERRAEDKALARHFKSCVLTAEAALAGKDGALAKLGLKYGKLQALIICKSATMTYFVPELLMVPGQHPVLVALHETALQDSEKLRVQVSAVNTAAGREQTQQLEDALIALKALQEAHATVRAQVLDVILPLYKRASPATRWAVQRLFFGGSSVVSGRAFDPWLDLTPYVIEGLTAEETELYVWQAHLSTSLTSTGSSSGVQSSAFLSFVGAVNSAAARGAINEPAWRALWGQVHRHVLASGPAQASLLTNSRMASTCTSGHTAGQKGMMHFNTTDVVMRALPTVYQD